MNESEISQLKWIIRNSTPLALLFPLPVSATSLVKCRKNQIESFFHCTTNIFVHPVVILYFECCLRLPVIFFFLNSDFKSSGSPLQSPFLRGFWANTDYSPDDTPWAHCLLFLPCAPSHSKHDTQIRDSSLP